MISIECRDSGGYLCVHFQFLTVNCILGCIITLWKLKKYHINTLS